jgi:hypothetical protein
MRDARADRREFLPSRYNGVEEAGAPDEALQEANMDREPSPNVAGQMFGEIAKLKSSLLKGDDED